MANVFAVIEEEQRENRHYLDRRSLRDAQDPFALPVKMFKENFRLSKELARFLIENLKPHMPTRVRSTRIHRTLRVLIALNAFGTGSYQRSVGNSVFHCVGRSMVSKIISEVVNALLKLTDKFITFPQSEVQRSNAKRNFEEKFNIKEVIAVVDGTLIAITTPFLNEHVYVCRKGYHAINMQLVCSADYRIISMNAKFPGSTHDSFIWRQSKVREAMAQNHSSGITDCFIIGDTGYPLQPWMLTKVENPTTPQEEAFNKLLLQVRSVVERVIGVLKGRWRCLLKQRTLHYQPVKAAKIIMACAILHNIASMGGDDDVELMFDDTDLAPHNNPPVGDNLRSLGELARDNYIQRNF